MGGIDFLCTRNPAPIKLGARGTSDDEGHWLGVLNPSSRRRQKSSVHLTSNIAHSLSILPVAVSSRN
jgi:hypothetical protein